MTSFAGPFDSARLRELLENERRAQKAAMTAHARLRREFAQQMRAARKTPEGRAAARRVLAAMLETREEVLAGLFDKNGALARIVRGEQ